MPNPLLEPSTRPFGLPDFAQLTTAHYREAIERGMAEQSEEVQAIRTEEAPANFENTVLALEISGQTLERATRIFFNKVSSDSDEELLALDEEMAQRLAAHEDAIRLDPTLFARVSTVRDGLDASGLDAESRELVERTWTSMQLAGAGLTDSDRTRLSELNGELAGLMSTFQKRLLAETNDSAVLFSSEEELDGLNDSQLGACRAAAEARGLDGWLVTLVLPTDHPYQARLTNRESRRRIHEASVRRCARGNENDTRELLCRIVGLRAERAAILGFPNHAAAATADQTAGTPERVQEVVSPLVAPVMANIRKEAALLQASLDAERTAAGLEPCALEPWDWSHCAERVRLERFALDTAALQPWFELDRVLYDGVFWAATQLYGITFTPRPEISTYHPEVRAFEVADDQGQVLGLYLLDAFTRDSKRGGAWMDNLVEQSTFRGQLPVVTNNLNVPKPGDGEPALLTLDEVVTIFHEFGHALHGLLSRATHASLAGTNVARDFVEFPSQVNEMWIMWPEVVEHYARHHETGEALAPEVLERLRESATFNQGFLTGEYLASALLDQEWHRIAPGTVIDDVESFEAEALERIGLANPWVLPRYRSAYFSHTFAGGYDAGYYAYIFSEILDADTVEWFRENGGLRRENGRRFCDEVLSRGRTRDPMESFRIFRGRDARIEPLLARRGLDQHA